MSRNAEEYIREVVTSWPPLTREQLDSVAVLLRAQRDDMPAYADAACPVTCPYPYQPWCA